jgi:WhiB family redox-sensing transcriptional regulator
VAGFPEPTATRPGEWAERAACRGYPTEWWFPWGDEFWGKRTMNERRADAVVAQRICGGCPVVLECYAHAALNREVGLWGGTSDEERRRFTQSERRRRARGRRVS